MPVEKKWVEVGSAAFQMCEDGETVRVFSPSGYQKVKLVDLPEDIRKMLMEEYDA